MQNNHAMNGELNTENEVKTLVESRHATLVVKMLISSKLHGGDKTLGLWDRFYFPITMTTVNCFRDR